jgi:predicted alpha/beta superfamily hydrolase
VRLRTCSFGALLACAIAVAPALAEPTPTLKVVSEGAFAPPRTQRFVVHYERVGRDFVVVVAAPAGPFVTPGRKLAAIYALDDGYGIAGPIGQLMAWSGSMSPAYLVSVGYPAGQADKRDTDLLFQPTVRGGVAIGGGGAAFQDFLIKELRPFVEARYPVDPARAVLFGHSYGGLFTANVLANTPQAFAGYIIASPSVAADPQLMAKLASAASRGEGRRVYLAAGEREDPATIAGTSQAGEILGAPASTFTVAQRVFTDEGHIGYYPQLVPAAFAWVLPPPAAPLVAHKPVAIAPEALDRLVGVYAIGDGRTVAVSQRQGKLYALLTGSPEGEFQAETPLRFFTAAVPGFDITLTFEAAANEPASTLVFSVNGVETRAVRQGR